ncbi:MAG: 4Fe-4S cluster-binding domain-containing protein [Bacteriovoracia bacterium]
MTHSSTLIVNSIFLATEGEGIFIGTPQLFLRLQGCSYHCKNCDTPESWNFTQNTEIMGEISLETIVNKLSELGRWNTFASIKRVSITGGDPLAKTHRESLVQLCKILKNNNIYLNIEVSGHEIVSEVFKYFDFINMDFKTPSTGYTGNIQNIISMNEQFPHKFQIKSPCTDFSDLKFLEESYLKLKDKITQINFPWIITPAFGVNEDFPKKRFIDILNWNEKNAGFFRVIAQQHKIIYGSGRKDV